MSTAPGSTQHRSTLRVLSVLEVLSNSDKGLTMAGICRELSAPKSSLFPIIHTMAEEGYISFDEETTRYRIGFKTYLAGKAYARGQDTVNILTEELRRIVDACGETAQAGILSGNKALYIAKVDSPQPIRLISDIGRALPVYCTAIGKALVSQMDRDELHGLVGDEFHAYTTRTFRTFDAFWSEMQAVREDGIAYDRGEMTDAIECMAVPVCVEGEVRYGVGVSVPSYRLTQEKGVELAALLQKARTHLEAVLS